MKRGEKMICNSLVMCTHDLHHIEVQNKDNKNRQNSKKKKNVDIYKQPLAPSPCGCAEMQKGCIGYCDKRTNPSCKEQTKIYMIDQGQQNPKKEVIQLKIDGGVITNPEASQIKKCDYALYFKEDKTMILIELKGTAVKHAVEQLMSTLKQAEFQDMWHQCNKIYGRIVCQSSIPRIRNTELFISAKKEFMARGGNLRIEEQSFVEQYNEL